VPLNVGVVVTELIIFSWLDVTDRITQSNVVAETTIPAAITFWWRSLKLVAYTHSSVVAVPLEEVFAWHARPGAIRRLVPPWQPVKVVAEAESLRDGRAVLGLPAGLRWTAAPQPGRYDPPRQFADELVTRPLGGWLRWTHVHGFTSAAGGGTRVTDTVTSRLPDRFMREMFAYRTRQLEGDLASHRWAGQHLTGPMTIAVTGSSGLIGSALSAFLTTGGHRVIRLVRGAPTGPDERRWNPDAPDAGLLEGVDAVVHLAGASIAGRFSRAHKDQIRRSRIGPTTRLAELAARAGPGLRCFIAASAIGYYGADRGDEELTETSAPGDGFLAEVVGDWERATAPAGSAGVRVVNVRTGVVQSASGGALGLVRPLFAAGLGGRLGDGRQWTSWIALDDLLDVFLRALVDPDVDGPLNAVAPDPVRNVDYTATLARVLKRPAVLPVPAFGPRLLLGGEGARELALASQRVSPHRLVETGHRFRFPTLEPALRHTLGHTVDRAGGGAGEVPSA
jgi:hypothetical protein